jgi:hypothetical protein
MTWVKGFRALATLVVGLIPMHAWAKWAPGHVPQPSWVPTYSVQYDSQARLGASVGVIRGVVGDTLTVDGPTTQIVVGRDAGSLGLGYARAWLLVRNKSLPPLVGVAGRLAVTRGWGSRGRLELRGLRIGPELELVLFGVKGQVALRHHVEGGRGRARSFSWTLGLGF